MASFVVTLCRPLPVTVRIRETVVPSSSEEVLEKQQQKEEVVTALTSHGFFVVTDGIYQLAAGVSKAELSSELRQLLTLYHQTGIIARQEIGSMLPVRLLLCAAASSSSSSSSSDQHPRTTRTTTTRVLDMCASPGSKTLQALEVFHHATIIANDINTNRLTILRDAVQRSGLSDDLIHRIQYTNQDASKFKLYVAAAAAKNGPIVTSSDREQQPQQQQLAKFRVILCDVPCSGDGTCRKDPSILPQWKPTIGNQLHAVQLAILQRGLLLLKPGGYLCYSTCSMYPVENEAVVAAALLAARENDEEEGVTELVDCPTEATRGFRLEPGLRHWLVAGHDANTEDDTGMVLYESYENALEHKSPDESTTAWLPSMWPPATSSNRVALQLTRCRRLWPHHQDSGGFFVAMFHKKKKKKKQRPKNDT
jgi:16S rRNA C967 or C1407 C5-methylase (RsmB/RsmF family)